MEVCWPKGILRAEIDAKWLPAAKLFPKWSSFTSQNVKSCRLGLPSLQSFLLLVFSRKPRHFLNQSIGSSRLSNGASQSQSFGSESLRTKCHLSREYTIFPALDICVPSCLVKIACYPNLKEDAITTALQQAMHEVIHWKFYIQIMNNHSGSGQGDPPHVWTMISIINASMYVACKLWKIKHCYLFQRSSGSTDWNLDVSLQIPLFNACPCASSHTKHSNKHQLNRNASKDIQQVQNLCKHFQTRKLLI